MSKSGLFFTAFLPAFALLAACGASNGETGRLEAAASAPVAELFDEKGELVSFDVYEDNGTVHLLVGIRPGKEHSVQLFYSRSSDRGLKWRPPVQLDLDPAPQNAVFTNAPQIAAKNGVLLALWTSRGTGFQGRGLIAGGFSTDGGTSWKKIPPPAPWPEKIDQGFLDVAAGEGDDFHLVWLDAREGQKGLQHNRFDAESESWTPVRTVDSRTCECCWNDLLVEGEDLYILYRDIDPRDMTLAFSSSQGNRWDLLGAAGDFDWGFDGCPHVGGGLAQTGSGVLHATVWTAQEKRAGLYYLRSPNGGHTWKDPQLLDARGRHSDVTSDSHGRVLAVWDSSKKETSAVFAQISKDEGSSWGTIHQISAPRAAGSNPRALTSKGTFLLYWVERLEEQPARLKVAPLQTEPRP